MAEASDLVRRSLAAALMLQTSAESRRWDEAGGVVMAALGDRFGQIVLPDSIKLPRNTDELIAFVLTVLERSVASVSEDVVGAISALSLAVVRLAELEQRSTAEVADELVALMDGEAS